MLSLIYRVAATTAKVALLLLVVAGIVAYAKVRWDLHGLKMALTQHIEAATGRRLTINGDVGFTILALPPRITADDVRIGNATWGSRADMIIMKRLEAEVDLLPLLMGDVAVPRLRMVGVDILLETNKRGVGNWEDLANFETAAGPAAPVVPLLGPILGAGTVSVAGGTLTVANAVTGKTTTLNLGTTQFELPAGIANPCL